MISSILSPFWAVFVTLRKNMMNVMQYLLRFLRLQAQAASFFEKKLKLAGDILSQDPKNQTEEGT